MNNNVISYSTITQLLNKQESKKAFEQKKINKQKQANKAIEWTK